MIDPAHNLPVEKRYQQPVTSVALFFTVTGVADGPGATIYADGHKKGSA